MDRDLTLIEFFILLFAFLSALFVIVIHPMLLEWLDKRKESKAKKDNK